MEMTKEVAIIIAATASFFAKIFREEKLMIAVSSTTMMIIAALMVDAEKPLSWVILSAFSVATAFAWLRVTEEDW